MIVRQHVIVLCCAQMAPVMMFLLSIVAAAVISSVETKPWECFYSEKKCSPKQVCTSYQHGTDLPGPKETKGFCVDKPNEVSDELREKVKSFFAAGKSGWSQDAEELLREVAHSHIQLQWCLADEDCKRICSRFNGKKMIKRKHYSVCTNGHHVTEELKNKAVCHAQGKRNLLTAKEIKAFRLAGFQMRDV
eukprot:GHVS01092816.1.p1 GENE.GHVS01092816.1~~GHVS01092816.1.p1  ORF type:complete len:191 (+),score=13.46 GHVS01092816.1:195-767(+)